MNVIALHQEFHLQQWSSLYWANPPESNNYKLWRKYGKTTSWRHLRADRNEENSHVEEMDGTGQAFFFKSGFLLHKEGRVLEKN